MAVPVVETVILAVPCPLVIVHPVGTVQLYVVALGTAEILYTDPVVLIHLSGDPLIVPGAAGVAAETVIAVFALVAVAGDAQGAFDVSTTETLSALLSVDEVKVGLLVPTSTPFTFH